MRTASRISARTRLTDMSMPSRREGKRLSKLAVALVSLFFVATAQAQTVKREYDRFKDQTNHEARIELSRLSDNTPRISLTLNATTRGESVLGEADKLDLTAIISYDMSRLSSCAGVGVDALIDGQPISLDKARPPFFAGNHAIVGSRAQLTFAQAQMLANSKVAEFRICDRVYVLTPDQLGAFKDLLALVQ